MPRIEKGGKMVLTNEFVTRFLAIVVTVFWEPGDYMQRRVASEYKGAAMHYKIKLWIPGWAFPLIWLPLKMCIAASYILFTEFTVTPAQDWPFVAMFVLFVVNQALSKTWMPLFFRYRKYLSSLLVSFVLMGTAWAYFGIAMANIGMRPDNLYLAPALLSLPYALWLTVAMAENFRWTQAVAEHVHREEPLYVPLKSL